MTGKRQIVTPNDVCEGVK